MSTSERNIFLVIQYDGGRFRGWQRQAGGPTVQQTVEEALEPINGAPVRLTGSGRTDAGVHALGQAANFRACSSHSPQAFLRAANARLPEDVAIVEAREAPLHFNARRDARLRWYRYRLAAGGVRPALHRATTAFVPYALDPALGARALDLFRGEHDFAGFRGAGCGARRTVLDLECWLCAEGGVWTFDFRCRSFLYNMARALVGATIEAARGKLPLEQIAEALATGRRGERIPTAPARGLTLMAVGYPPAAFNG
ncbi:MAG: tRNA pseudouridine synthase A [candidate division BRC1 bacterium ADurb.BinA364]|nr:MAG: tRNA pseudouridine synthase A [candidate division BRC1 bacterium ADurb.BinA364]